MTIISPVPEPFTIKSTLKPILAELFQSKLFDAAYEACTGIRIILNVEDVATPSFEIDLHDPSDLTPIATFQIDNEDKLFEKIKAAIIEFYGKEIAYSSFFINDKIDLVASEISPAQYLDKADDICISSFHPILVSDPETKGLKEYEDQPYKDYQCINFSSHDPEYIADTIYVKR